MQTTAIGYRDNLPTSDPQCFEEREVDVPEIGPHDLLVEVEAVSVNPVDTKVRQGVAPHGFKVLGYDAAGTVREIGAEVTLFAPGDPVYYAGTIDRPGTNSRLHVVDERIVGPKPSSLSFADAAALPLTTITAYESLFDHLGLTPESEGHLLVVGATGGVGSVMVQLAAARLPNVQIIGTASDDARGRWVRELGAHHVVNHRDDLAGHVLAIAPGGVDWMFTAHSEGQIETYAQIVAPLGHIVAIDDGERDVSPLKDKSIAWHWELMFTRPVQQTPDLVAQHDLLERVAGLVDEGRVRSTVEQTLSPINAENLRQAHEAIESGRTLGKIVLTGWQD